MDVACVCVLFCFSPYSLVSWFAWFSHVCMFLCLVISLLDQCTISVSALPSLVILVVFPLSMSVCSENPAGCWAMLHSPESLTRLDSLAWPAWPRLSGLPSLQWSINLDLRLFGSTTCIRVHRSSLVLCPVDSTVARCSLDSAMVCHPCSSVRLPWPPWSVIHLVPPQMYGIPATSHSTSLVSLSFTCSITLALHPFIFSWVFSHQDVSVTFRSPSSALIHTPGGQTRRIVLPAPPWLSALCRHLVCLVRVMASGFWLCPGSCIHAGFWSCNPVVTE